MQMRILFLSLTVFFFSTAFSQSIRGKVVDSQTGEPLIGANVILEPGHRTTAVELNGAFTFRHVNPGKYTVKVSTIGYENSTPIDVELTQGHDALGVNFNL